MKILFALLAFVLISCKHSYYLPNTHLEPMFDGGKQAVVSYIPKVSKSSINQIQAAIAITNHIAIQYSQFGITEKWQESYGGIFGGARWTEHFNYKIKSGAVGYFTTIKNKFPLAINVGYAQGSADNKYEYNWAIADFKQYYLQSSFGLKNKSFNVIYSNKICYFNYHNIRARLYGNETGTAEAQYVKQNPNPMIMEHAITYQFGYKFLKIDLQAGYLQTIKHKQFNYFPVWNSISLLIDLRKENFIFRKKKTK